MVVIAGVCVCVVGCEALVQRCARPRAGTYRVQWLSVPADCPFLAEPAWIQIDIEHSYCLSWVQDGETCSLRANRYGDPDNCGYPILGAQVMLGAESLLPVGPGRFEGEATAWVNDIRFGPASPQSRRCAEPGRVELRFDPDHAPSSVVPSAFLNCDEAGGGCADMDCQPIAGTPFDACAPPAPTASVPDEAFRCIAACKAGLACQYAAGEPHAGIGQCLPVPAIGAACGESVDAQQPPLCDGLAYCDEQRICRAQPQLGEACQMDFENCGRDPCTNCDRQACCLDGYCRPDGTGRSVCQPWQQQGEPCDGTADTLEGLACAGDLTCECLDTACSDAVCMEVRHSQERCDEPNVTCASGLECRNGVCQ